MKTLFKETQKFTQWWLWVLMIGIGMIPVIGIYKQLIIDEEFGSKPMSDVGLMVFSVFIYLLIAFFYFLQLKTKITSEEISFTFYPLASKKVKWKDISEAKVVNYGFVGGWGIRLWTPYGTVYNIKGKIGLAIELKNGSKFLIGTQKETELKNVLKEITSLNEA
ncbi:MAG: phosphoethanolamine transferase domain-containing protein [Flavobacteriaceae bacterium]|nr:phosphoethanolamine transferase domain-containing protein [Flavobacteriaceae bacterium]